MTANFSPALKDKAPFVNHTLFMKQFTLIIKLVIKVINFLFISFRKQTIHPEARFSEWRDGGKQTPLEMSQPGIRNRRRECHSGHCK